MRVVEGRVEDRDLVYRLFAEFKPSHVIHSAAAYKDPDDWVEDTRTNVEGTIHVVEAAKAAGVKRFVNPHTYPVGLEKSLHQLKTELIIKLREGERNE